MKGCFVTHLSNGRNVIISYLIFHTITTTPLGFLMLMYGDSTNLPFAPSNRTMKAALVVFFIIASMTPPYCSLYICRISSLLIDFAFVARSFSLAVLFTFSTSVDNFSYSLRIALMSNVNIILIVLF